MFLLSLVHGETGRVSWSLWWGRPLLSGDYRHGVTVQSKSKTVVMIVFYATRKRAGCRGSGHGCIVMCRYLYYLTGRKLLILLEFSVVYSSSTLLATTTVAPQASTSSDVQSVCSLD